MGETNETAFATLAQSLRDFVPFVRTLGLEYEEISPERAVVVLPDRTEVHNHLGGPHAGALFSAGETASGAVVLAAFSDHLDRLTPVAARGEVTYRKLAMGTVSAEAVATRKAADVLAALDAGEKPEFPITVTFRTADGTQTGQMTVVWVLLANR